MNAIQSMMDEPQYQEEWDDELTENGLTPAQYPLEAYVTLCMFTDASLRFDAQGTPAFEFPLSRECLTGFGSSVA